MTIHWLTDEEFNQIIDDRAKKVLGLSGEAFLRCRHEWNAYNESPFVPGLMELLMLTQDRKVIR